MLKKYLINNNNINEDLQYSAIRRKSNNKNGTPITYSVGTADNNNSVDSKTFFDSSVLSNRSHLDNTNIIQTPRTGVSRKLKALDSKKSNLTTQSFKR